MMGEDASRAGLRDVKPADHSREDMHVRPRDWDINEDVDEKGREQDELQRYLLTDSVLNSSRGSLVDGFTQCHKLQSNLEQSKCKDDLSAFGSAVQSLLQKTVGDLVARQEFGGKNVDSMKSVRTYGGGPIPNHILQKSVSELETTVCLSMPNDC